MSAQVLRAGANRAAIGHVHDAGRYAQFAHAVEAGEKQFFLVVGLAGGEIFGGGEVRVGAFELEVATFGQRVRTKASTSIG